MAGAGLEAEFRIRVGVLTIYGRKSSFNLQKVMWLTAELAIPHRHIEFGGSFGGLDAPAFRAMNPHGRVPVIDDGGTIVWESHAILRYLAARYGGAQFWSDDPAERSQADRWMDWSQTALQPDFLMGVFWGYYRTPAAERNMAAVEASVRRCARHFQLLEGILGDCPYLLGDRLSLADIPIGTHLYRYFNIDIARPALPNIERWYRGLEERAAYQAHVMVPFDELHGRLAY
jgi:glutathione S-transferase